MWYEFHIKLTLCCLKQSCFNTNVVNTIYKTNDNPLYHHSVDLNVVISFIELRHVAKRLYYLFEAHALSNANCTTCNYIMC